MGEEDKEEEIDIRRRRGRKWEGRARKRSEEQRKEGKRVRMEGRRRER